MDVIAATAKAVIAVMLLVAGGAKLADLAGFSAAVRLVFSFRAPWPLVRATALAVALTELAVGAASLCSPATGWLNPVVFALTCAFVAVSGFGYAFHRGRSCRCFGALSHRRFDALGVARSALIAAVAGLAMSPLPPAAVAVSTGDSVLLLLSGAVVALAAFSAAHALGVARAGELETS